MPVSRSAVIPTFPGPMVPHVCPPQPALSAVEGADVGSSLRRWKVMHACDVPALALPVAQAQIEAGMHASLLTPEAGYPTSGRFWQMWDCGALPHTCRDFRRWRRLLAAESTEILHTHCLSAGLAAVRGRHLVVCDLRARVARVSDTWTPHLLRLTENFALARAAAVVVHSQHMWAEALRRGVSADDLFLVPDPVESRPEQRVARAFAGAVVLFAPDAGDENEIRTLLRAFAMLADEIEGAQLLLEAEGELAEFIARGAQELDIAPAVRVVAPFDRPRALQEADIIIAGKRCDENPSTIAIAALAHGRALLAADVPQNREVTPQGSGCIWYRVGDANDLACRAAFLARNADFRAALAASGRIHLAATRGPAVVARLYDQVYRHAWRKRTSGPGDIVRQLVLQASL